MSRLITGAASSYASSALINQLKIKPAKVERRRIEMMIGSVTKNIELYKIRANSLESDFYLEMQVSKIEREKLLVLEIIAKYNHLQAAEMIDKDNKAELPVQLVIGANEYTQIKTENAPKIGRQGEPNSQLPKGRSLVGP